MRGGLSCRANYGADNWWLSPSEVAGDLWGMVKGCGDRREAAG